MTSTCEEAAWLTRKSDALFLYASCFVAGVALHWLVCEFGAAVPCAPEGPDGGPGGLGGCAWATVAACDDLENGEVKENPLICLGWLGFRGDSGSDARDGLAVTVE
jgi:hypothetical protein